MKGEIFYSKKIEIVSLGRANEEKFTETQNKNTVIRGHYYSCNKYVLKYHEEQKKKIG